MAGSSARLAGMAALARIRVRGSFGSLGGVRGCAAVIPGPSFWLERRESLEGMAGRESFDLSRNRQRQGGSPLAVLDQAQRQVAAQMQQLGRQRRWQEALQLFAAVPAPAQALRQVALDACAKSFQLAAAKKLFDEMPQKTVTAYTSMMAVSGRHKQILEVEGLLQEMQANSLQPERETLTTVMIAYGMVHRVNDALQVFRDIESTCAPPDKVEFAAALSACGKSGASDQATELLAKMNLSQVAPDLGHFTSAIVSCGQAKNEARARELFDEMRGRGVLPDVVAYTSLACCISGLPEVVGSALAPQRLEGLITEMKSDALEPHIFFYDQVLRVLAEAGEGGKFRAALAELEARGLQRSGGTARQLRNLENRERAQRAQREAGLSQVAEQPLPNGWKGAVDPTSGSTYYWHVDDPQATTTWERPA